MFHHIRPIAAGALLATASMMQPALAEDAPTADTVVATVNGAEITLGHMIALRAGLPGQFAQLPAEVLYKGILDQIVQQTLLEQSLEADLTKSRMLRIENERRALFADQALDSIRAEAVNDDAIDAAYEAQYLDAEPPIEYSAAHILVETEEKASALIAELEAGADFAALAQEHSTGPSGPNGGSLGWFSDGMMVEPFQNAVAAMEPGSVSAPVQTQFGWHVIKLNETREGDSPPLDDVRLELEEKILQDAIAARVDALMANAEVDRAAGDALDPSILNQFELLEE